MNTTSIRPGDIVHCDIRGARFFARVKRRDQRETQVEPITRGFGSMRTVTARQIIGHYRKAKGSA